MVTISGWQLTFGLLVTLLLGVFLGVRVLVKIMNYALKNPAATANAHRHRYGEEDAKETAKSFYRLAANFDSSLCTHCQCEGPVCCYCFKPRAPTFDEVPEGEKAES